MSLATLEAWVARRAGTLMGRLASTVWRRERQASETADAAYKRATDGANPDPEAVRRSRRRLLVCWGLIGSESSLAPASGVPVCTRITDSLDWPDYGRWAGILIVICTMLALYGGWQYYRALSQFERQVQRLLADRRHVRRKSMSWQVGKPAGWSCSTRA